MLFFGICLIVGAMVDVFLTGFTFSHLLLMILGVGLLAVNLVGEKIKNFGGIGKSVVSLLAIFIVGFLITGMSANNELIDKETGDILKMADKIYEEKGIEAAIKHLENSNNDLGWRQAVALKIGEMYSDGEMLKESAQAYGNVLRNLPNDLDVRLIYGKALLKNNDLNGAYREANYIVNIDLEYIEAYVLLGDTYRAWNDHFREKYFYKVAVGLDETSVFNRVHLAEAYGRTHSYETAIEHYEMAKEYAETYEEETAIYESYIRMADNRREEN